MQYPQACLISTYDVNNNSNNNSTLNPFCALGKFRQQLQHKSKMKRWIVQLRIHPVIEAQCTANVCGPLKETESFLLHTVIITTKNVSFRTTVVLKNSSIKSTRTSKQNQHENS